MDQLNLGVQPPGHVYTTRGWLPADQVELRESVTHEDDQIRIVRVDKYHQGQWVGNDLHGHIKTGHELKVVAEPL